MPEEVFVEPKSKNWPKIVLVAIFGFALLFAAAYAGYWYGAESANLKSTTQNQETPTPSPTPNLAPTPTVEDETKDWKTYTNTKHKYMFRYPPKLVLVKGPAEGSPPEVFQTLDTISFDSPEFGLAVHVNPDDAKGNPIACSTDEECKSRFLAVLQTPASETTPFSSTVFGKVRIGFKHEITNPLYTTYSHYLVFLEGGNLWVISVYSQDHLPNYTLVDQILSTFKFLD